jgi:hypothetical protein
MRLNLLELLDVAIIMARECREAYGANFPGLPEDDVLATMTEPDVERVLETYVLNKLRYMFTTYYHCRFEYFKGPNVGARYRPDYVFGCYIDGIFRPVIFIEVKNRDIIKWDEFKGALIENENMRPNP